MDRYWRRKAWEESCCSASNRPPDDGEHVPVIGVYIGNIYRFAKSVLAYTIGDWGSRSAQSGLSQCHFSRKLGNPEMLLSRRCHCYDVDIRRLVSRSTRFFRSGIFLHSYRGGVLKIKCQRISMLLLGNCARKSFYTTSPGASRYCSLIFKL